jgi:hypothetical protein
VITDTLFVVGPGGTGKSPLDKGLRDEIARIDPYRLRNSGPRDSKDKFYAHPKLRDDLYLIYQRLGLGLTYLSANVHWFPQARTLFIKVRNEWQVLLLEGLPSGVAKAEIFAPVVPVLLANPQVRHVFGRVSVVILNPAGPLATLTDLADIKSKTRHNCEKRGDTPDDVSERVDSVDQEVEAWRQMISLGATEYPNWEFAEYVYREKGENETLLAARSALLERSPQLEIFFKTKAEIRSGPMRADTPPNKALQPSSRARKARGNSKKPSRAARG